MEAAASPGHTRGIAEATQPHQGSAGEPVAVGLGGRS